MSNESEDDIQSCLDDELETLRSIYLNELEVLCDKGCPVIVVQLHPSTADNVDEQYVRMSLILYLPAGGYPDVIPDIQIKNPRGLSDEKLQRITDDLFSKAEERKGSAMLFELIECAKDHLTAGNRPSCQCAICLYGFTEQDVFTKTKCYHYFHSHCLSRYVTHQLREFDVDQPVEHSESEGRREIFCPVCRVPISFFVPEDSNFPPPASAVDDCFTITEELKQLQNKMADLYKKQGEKGGIIDIEAEKKKFLLEISSVPSKTQPVSEAEQPNGVRSSASEEMHCDLGQQKKELILLRNKSSEQSENDTSTSKQSPSWCQKYNRRGRGRDSSYTASRNSGAKNNKCQEMKKSNRVLDEVHPKSCLIQELRYENCANAKSVVRNKLGREKKQEDDEMQKVAYPEFSTCLDHGLSTFDTDTTEIYSTNRRVECVQSKCHRSERTHSRHGYHKGYKNCNHHNNFCKQCQCSSDNGKKHFSVTHGSLFDTEISLSDRSDNCQQPRQVDDLHQMKTAGSYIRKSQNEENYLKQSGQRSNYHGNKQSEEFVCRHKQTSNYNKSREDFHRRHRYSSRFEQYNSYRKELTRYCDTERTGCEVSKDHSIEGDSIAQNIQDNLDQVSVDESIYHQHSKMYGNQNRRNFCSSRRINKLQHEHHKYPNKYEDRPRNSCNSHLEHQRSLHPLEKSSASRNCDGTVTSEAHASSNRYLKHPYRKPHGKKSDEAHRINFSPIKNQNSALEVPKIHDDCTPVFENSSNCNENCSPVIDSFSVKEVKSDLALRNADTNHPVPRPPPGFAKKVVYGLPSVKPPPGFSQS